MSKILLPTTALSLASAYLLPRHFPEILSASPVIVFLTTFIPLFLAQVVFNVIIYPKFLSPLRHLPGPKPSSLLLGVFPTIYRLPSGQPHTEWIKIPNNGLIRYLGIWNREAIFPTSPQTLKEVMHTQAHIFVKPMSLGGLSTVLGERGLFFAQGQEHRHYRKMLMPSFALRHLKELVPVFWEKALEMGNGIAAEVATASEDVTTGDAEKGKGKLVDLTQWASLATLDIIGAAGFGYDFGALKNGEGANELSAAYASLLKRDKTGMLTFMLYGMLPHSVLYWLPTARARTVRKAHRTIQSVSRQLIRDRRAAQRARGEKSGDAKDILSVMLNSGEFDTPDGEEIARDQIMTFLAAGHETTASSIAWAVYCLTAYPEHQTAIRNEIRTTFPHGLPSTITYEDLERLPLLRNFCSEVLRFYPPVPITIRAVSSSTTLHGQYIPKGTYAVIVPWAIHRDTSLWGPDAAEFNPKRWEERGKAGTEGGESSYAFQTFISGPRSCIGERFSILEFRALLVVIIGKFELEKMAGELEIKNGITAKPKEGRVWVKEVPGWA